MAPDERLEQGQAVAEDSEVELETRPNRCTGLSPGHVGVGLHCLDVGDADDGGYAGAVGVLSADIREQEAHEVWVTYADPRAKMMPTCIFCFRGMFS